MLADIIKIGNSKGLRIPKTLLEQCEFKTTVELTVENHSLIIRAHEAKRKGWDKAFQRMAAKGDDTLLEGEDLTPSWDEDEWTW